MPRLTDEHASSLYALFSPDNPTNDSLRVGVATWEALTDPDRFLKPYAMLFDHIEVPGKIVLRGMARRFDREREIWFAMRDKVALLERAGIVKTPMFAASAPDLWETGLSPEDVSAYRELHTAMSDTTQTMVQLMSGGESNGAIHNEETIRTAARAAGCDQARFTAAALRLFHKKDAVCVGDAAMSYSTSNIERSVTRSDLYQIVVCGLPVPDARIPWEELVVFRSDAVAKQQLRALRLWISDMANGKLSYADALDKIEYLKGEYRSHMKGAEVKFGASSLEVIVTGIAGIIENSFKLRLKDMVEAPFRLNKIRGELIEAERNAPGRELAYLVRSEDFLARRQRPSFRSRVSAMARRLTGR